MLRPRRAPLAEKRQNHGVSTALPYPGPPPQPGVFKDLARFARSPRSEMPTGPRPFITFLKMIGIQFLALLVTTPLIGLGFWLISDKEFIGDQDIGKVELFILAVIAAPILEELAFRLAITKYTPMFLILGGIIFGLFGGLSAFALDVPLGVRIAVVIVAVAIAATLIALGASSSTRAEGVWERNFARFFYGSVVVFGLFHLSNYSFGDLAPWEYLAFPLLVAPQIAVGFLLGYTRIRLGIFWAMGQHAFYNLVLVSLALSTGGS